MNPNEITKEDQILNNTTFACDILKGLREDLQEDRKDVRSENTKHFLGLIGVIMALIGQKLISTPWYVDVAVILSLVVGTFLVGSLLIWWKFFSKSQRAVRISGSLLLLVSSICQIFVYHPGEELPPNWFPLITNIGMILIALSLLWSGWTEKPKNGKHK
jgi:peptidoglycan/LPS O-acetylase OafA/YrhL